MRTAVIVQARMGSSRLPGKVMMDLAGEPVLAHVLKRCHAISFLKKEITPTLTLPHQAGGDKGELPNQRGGDKGEALPSFVVVCAMPDEVASKPLEEVAEACGAVVFRGSEADVLDRYYRAAQSVAADVILRVTSDCPLIDPDVCRQVLALREIEGADYACNNMPRSFPHGLDCEAFTFAALEEAALTARVPEQREHVTPYLRAASHFRRANLSCPVAGISHFRWTLDYPEDFDFFRAVFARLDTPMAGYEDVLACVEAEPELLRINQLHASTGSA